MRRLLMLMLLAATTASPAAAPRESGIERPLIVALGDSLTAGYQLPPGQGFAPQLQATLRRHGIAASVVDAGVSGDTSTGGRQRLEWTLDGLPRPPDLVIVELGANDMLRGVDPAITRENLDSILAELKRRKRSVLVSGMRAPANVDPAYAKAFDALYPELAKRHGAAFDPFFLEGLEGRPDLALPDGVHPNFEGVKAIAARLAGPVKAALRRGSSN